jgi:hypothetical protein
MRTFPVVVLAVCLILAALATAQEGSVVTVDAAACRQLVPHVASDDVTYRPGVDVHGRPVVAADVAGGAVALPDEITVDLKMPLGQVLGTATPPRVGQSDVNVGKVTVDTAGRKVLLNGQPLPDPAAHAIAEECGRRYGRGRS